MEKKQKKKVKGQMFTMPSKTIQGQSYTVKDLLKRQEAGMPVTMDYRLVWAGEEDEEQITFNDLTDIDMAKKIIDNLNAKVKAEEKRMKEEAEKVKEEPALKDDVKTES